MSYICHIMNVVPPCETSNSEMRSPCETHAKPILQSLAPNAMLELPDPGMLGMLLQIGAGPQRLWMSLVLCSLVLDATCPQCKNSLMPTPLSFLSFLSRYQEPFAVLLPVTLPLH